MAVVVIAGVPKNQKLLKFISFLQGLIGDISINTSLLKTKYTNDFAKKIFITVRAGEARRLRWAVDGYVYKYAGKEYPLRCWQEDNDEKVARHRGAEDEGLECSQPSTDLTGELETIDQKIEVVRKERVLVEEESRLLLEKKKLQILKHIGVNDVENLKKFLEIRDRNNPAEIAEFSREVIDKPILQNKLSCNNLPHFHGPCKAIFVEMKDVISKYINPDNRAILLPLLRSTVKKRLVVVLQGKPHMVLPDIVREYRELYPMAADDEMLQALIRTISQSCWPKPARHYEDQKGDAGSDSQNKEPQPEKANKTYDSNVIDLTSEPASVSTDDELVKETTIIDPEDADLIDVDNDFDDWIEEEDANQNSDSKNVCEIVLNENNRIDNSKESKIEENEENVKYDEVQMEEHSKYDTKKTENVAEEVQIKSQ